MMFSEEKILQDAKKFSSEFLHRKRDRNEILDKWIITKDLPGEVTNALYKLLTSIHSFKSKLMRLVILFEYIGKLCT